MTNCVPPKKKSILFGPIELTWVQVGYKLEKIKLNLNNELSAMYWKTLHSIII